jgi:ActR/RegA family two-component response regulator
VKQEVLRQLDEYVKKTVSFYKNFVLTLNPIRPEYILIERWLEENRSVSVETKTARARAVLTYGIFHTLLQQQRQLWKETVRKSKEGIAVNPETAAVPEPLSDLDAMYLAFGRSVLQKKPSELVRSTEEEQKRLILLMCMAVVNQLQRAENIPGLLCGVDGQWYQAALVEKLHTVQISAAQNTVKWSEEQKEQLHTHMKTLAEQERADTLDLDVIREVVTGCLEAIDTLNEQFVENVSAIAGYAHIDELEEERNERVRKFALQQLNKILPTKVMAIASEIAASNPHIDSVPSEIETAVENMKWDALVRVYESKDSMKSALKRFINIQLDDPGDHWASVVIVDVLQRMLAYLSYGMSVMCGLVKEILSMPEELEALSEKLLKKRITIGEGTDVE